MSEAWVINASPIILLGKAGLIDLVPKIAALLVVPRPVQDEIQAGPAADPGRTWLGSVGSVFVCSAVPEPREVASADIGAGERSVIAWALANPSFIAVLDDLAARRLATKLGAKTIGSVGVLLRLKRSGLIPEIRAPLLLIRQAGGHIGEDLFQRALTEAGEL